MRTVAPFALVASVGDDHTAVEDLALTWSSTVDGPLDGVSEIDVTTEALELDGLAPGEHVLTLTAKDHRTARLQAVTLLARKT